MKFYLLVIIAMSAISFLLYASDKSRAKKKRRRIRESTLLSIGFFGGAIGALLAMKLFRHKTKHTYFWIINVLGLVLQIALAVIIYLFQNKIGA